MQQAVSSNKDQVDNLEKEQIGLEDQENAQINKESSDNNNQIINEQQNQQLPIEQNELDKSADNQSTKDESNQQLVDKSNNKDDLFLYGINKYLYKKVEPSELQVYIQRLSDFWKKSENFTSPVEPGVKTGTDFILLPRNPEFLMSAEPYEPMYIPKQNILEESLRREIERICFADTLINRVVYDCSDASPFTKDIDPQSVGMDILPFYFPQSNDDISLVFESRFESGNLRRAIQICDYEYNLILKPDYFTTGHTQWFYFSVSNTRKDVEYRFNIINMMKPDSLYNAGMKPLIYSEALAKQKKIGWHRDGFDICYYQNNMKRKNAGFYYTLTFAIKFPYDFDCIYFAHCYPYTYSQLCRSMRVLENEPTKKNRVKRKTLCQTIAGNNCDFLIIGDFNNGKEKKGILLTSRVHPGETMTSYVIEYIIDYLTGNTQEARILRENFIFKIVSMLNIDGVINGNYRCNLSGVDLNRQWIDPSRKLHPSIFHTKQLLKKMREEKDLMLYCDFHGHSRKKNIFMYGCTGKDPKKGEQIFPILMRNNSNFFSFKDCTFLLQKDREGSARIALWRELNIVNCYTLEMSFCGADFGKYEYFHFNLEHYNEIGQSFCQAIIDSFEPEQLKVKLAQDEIEQMSLKQDKKESDKAANSGDEDSDYSNEDPKDSSQNQQNIQQNDIIPMQNTFNDQAQKNIGQGQNVVNMNINKNQDLNKKGVPKKLNGIPTKKRK